MASYCTTNTATIDQIALKVKEPTELLFFRGAQCEFTYDKENVFSQSQVAALFELPSRDDVAHEKKIKTLAAPVGMKFFDFDVKSMSKADLIQLGFIEVLIGILPERTLCLNNDAQGKRTQHGSRHRVTSTIHATQGETSPQMATKISDADPGTKDNLLHD